MRAVIDAAPPEAAGSRVFDELARAVDLCPQLDERLSVLEGDPRNLAERWIELAPLADAALDDLLQTRFARSQQAEAQVREQRRTEQRERDQARQRAVREQRAQALSAALDLAEAALAAGQLAPTHGHLLEIDKLLTGGASAGALRGRIDGLQAQYAQLKGWQHWAGGRARDELVQQAEALAAATSGSPADARAVKLSTKQQAELIDDMRTRWKELDRLGGATSRSLWQRFDAALKAAYEPVARQVAVQRVAREQNLLARERLLADLEAVPLACAGDGAPAFDGRVLAVALDQFQTAWRKLGPIEHTVPNRARDPLVERMHAALLRLEAPLQEARRVARLQRERLLAHAKALATESGAGAAGRDLVDKVRELQAQWQQQARALPLARADENALWLEFKTAIDGAFSAREAAFHARDAEFKAHGAERAALIERLESLGADTPAAQLKRTLAEVDASWQRAGPAPRSEAQALDAAVPPGARRRAPLAGRERRASLARHLRCAGGQARAVRRAGRQRGPRSREGRRRAALVGVARIAGSAGTGVGAARGTARRRCARRRCTARGVHRRAAAAPGGGVGPGIASSLRGCAAPAQAAGDEGGARDTPAGGGTGHAGAMAHRVAAPPDARRLAARAAA